jgi:hypothetical protein
MDRWKFFDITHREHVLCNPMSIDKLEELIELLRLEPGVQVLDIAMGKAEFIVRLAEAYEIEGVGVDLSPHCVADAEEKHARRVPDADLTFLEMDGADYEPAEPESFDLVACIGASWIYGGHRGTLEALKRMAAPGAWIVAGEPHWRQEPPAAYLQALGEERSAYGTHYENVETGRELGLEPVYTLVSSEDDWDRYEGLQWYGAVAWATEHPDDPDVEELLERVRDDRETYLRWGRETLGWAIYVFRK